MEQARALQVKAEHDIRHCTTAVGQAAQSLRHIQQEAAEAAETVWRRQVAQHEAAVRHEQEAFQAEQVWSETTLPCPGPLHAALPRPTLPCPALPCPAPPCSPLSCLALLQTCAALVCPSPVLACPS